TWRDPAWWRYNILRHRYVEPLHPDDFVEGGRFTETLIALTGIPSPDTFFDERNRAIREVAAILQRAAHTGEAAGDLQRMALAHTCQPLQSQPEARRTLGIAAIFEGIFPRTLLLQLAQAENIRGVGVALDFLTGHRFLLTGDEGNNLWLCPALRDYIYQHEARTQLRLRHQRAARHYLAEGQTLAAGRHLQQASQWEEAAAVLLDSAGELLEDLQADELRSALEHFPAGRLADQTWSRVQMCLSDVCAAQGDADTAVAACRAALKTTAEPEEQARIFRRMGKLYEKRNPMHALNYYRQAEERFVPDDHELVTLLKDRGWLHIHRRAWDAAAADLDRALALAPAEGRTARADVLDAMASLHRNQGLFDQAIACAQQALALREQTGDLLRVAKSLGNLGLLYTATADYDHAIAAHQEAMGVYARLGNQELRATAILNIGLAQHLAGRLADAAATYRQSLALCREIDVPLAELRVLANLVEVLAELGDLAAAQQYLDQGFEIARRHAFDDEAAYLTELAERFPSLAPDGDTGAKHAAAPQAIATAEQASSEPAPVILPIPVDPEARAALHLAKTLGRVTPRTLMEAAGVSKATATRRLAMLAEEGWLARQGKGRGTCYVPGRLASVEADAPPAPIQPARADVLRNAQRELAAQFNVAGLGQLPGNRLSGSVELVVRFRVLPDLLQFFRLKAHLAGLLGTAVELTPEAALENQQTIWWIW
ncbi:MAG: tetratricopeptide repeat protein, partial [Caldilineaceae bacterium]|nr:tetratricopeptide repeat protein [Caldilineaceae bacterium]